MLFLTAPLLLLALISVYFDWLGFPLTVSLNAHQITWDWHDHFTFSLGEAFQLMMAIGAVLMLRRQFFISLIFLSAALSLLLFMPWYAGFVHPDWLANYVMQGQERMELYYFTRQYFVLNVISEPTFVPAEQFESLLDQAAIAVSMISAGWYIALTANLALLVVLLHHWQFPLQLPIALALIMGFGLLPAYRSALVLAQASKVQYQGNQHLVHARASQALQCYKQALKLNPALTYSTPFLLKAADAYAILTNERHPSSKISEAWMIIQKEGLFKSNIANPKSYREVRTLLQETSDNYLPLTALERALAELSRGLIARLWRYQGLAEYERGNLHKAMHALQQDPAAGSHLTARFYLASLHIKLNDPLPAITLLQPYVDQVAHPSAKADIYCTIGDAYTRAKNALKARQAYSDCTKWDNIKNYRVIRALSGF